MPTFFAHPTALIESDDIGQDTRVWAFAHIMRGATVGAHCNIGDHAFIESGALVGDGVTLKNNVCVWEGVTIEDDVFVGPGVVFTNDLLPRSARAAAARARYAGKGWLVATRVAAGASVGANATIRCGITLGECCMVGAGSVVTRDVAPFTLVCGNPARVKGRVNAEGRILKRRGKHWVDPETGRRYRVRGDAIEACGP